MANYLRRCTRKFALARYMTAFASQGLRSGASNVDSIQEEFRKQGPLYAPHPAAMQFVMSEVGEISGAKALDVASGTGAFAMALAPLFQSVVAFDLTKEMLARAEKESKEKGITNIDFQQGDAVRMPFEDETFDIVTSRLAVHHFPDPHKQVGEMVRVCKKGGRIVLSDIVADDDPAQHAEQDRLETLRDPSHTATVTLEGLHSLLSNTGRVELKPHSGNIYHHPLNADFWLRNSLSSPEVCEEVRRSLQAEMSGGAKTGMLPMLDDNKELTFRHRYAVAQAIRL